LLRDLVGSLLRNTCQRFKGFFVDHGLILSDRTEALCKNVGKELKSFGVPESTVVYSVCPALTNSFYVKETKKTFLFPPVVYYVDWARRNSDKSPLQLTIKPTLMFGGNVSVWIEVGQSQKGALEFNETFGESGTR
jgi:hypothetical protein